LAFFSFESLSTSFGVITEPPYYVSGME